MGAKKNKTIRNIGDLKSFIEEIPDETPVFGEFYDEIVEAFFWVIENDGSGSKEFFSLETM